MTWQICESVEFSQMPNLIVLIVEDHPSVLDSIERMVEQWPDIDIHSAENFLSAAIWIHSIERLDLLLCEVSLPGGMSGIEVADVATKTHADVAVVLFSDEDRSEIADMRAKYEFVQRPFEREQLTRHIDNAFSKLHASAEWLIKFADQEPTSP